MYKCISLAVVLLMVITATILIVIGCGGNDNTVSPNIYTPTPGPGKMAYITVRVTWPGKGEEGSYMISSSNNKVETYRLPDDAQRIEVKVTQPGSEEVIAEGGLSKPDTKLELGIPILVDNNPDTPSISSEPAGQNTPSLLPPIAVKITAKAYDTPLEGGNLLSEASVEQTLSLGISNPVNLNLGEYVINLKESPTLYIAKAHKIVAEVMVKDHDILLMPAKDRTIKFDIIQSSNSKVLYTSTGITGEDGTCNTEVKLPEPLNKAGVENASINVSTDIEYTDAQNRGVTTYSDSRTVKIIGKYDLIVSAWPQYININRNKEENGNIEPPKVGGLTIPAGGTPTPFPTATPYATPSSSEEVLIAANLRIIYPSVSTEPNTVNEPAPPAKNVEGKEIKFSIVSGPGELLSDRAITNSDGYATVGMRPTGTGVVYIKAEYQSDPSDAGSIYSSTCVVNASVTYEYTMWMGAEPKRLIIIPDFSSDYFDLIKKSTISVSIGRSNPIPGNTPINLTGKEVKFTLTGQGQLSSQSVYTDSDGKCSLDLTGFDNASGDIKIRGECVIDPNRSPVVYTLSVPVSNNLIREANFENYETGTTIKAMANSDWNYPHWRSYDSNNRGYITDTGVNNSLKSVYLYGATNLNYYELYHIHQIPFVSGIERYEYSSPPPNNELRFSICTGSEQLEHASDLPGHDGKRFRGIVTWWLLSEIMYFCDDNCILDKNRDVIGIYNPGIWNNLKIQFIADNQKMVYWINGTKVKTISYVPNVDIDRHKYNNADVRVPGWQCGGGSLWLDDMYLYDLNGLPRK